MNNPYRPETDQVEKAQQETIKQQQLESRLAEASPAKPGEAATPLSKSESQVMRARLGDRPVPPQVAAAQRLEVAEPACSQEVLMSRQMTDTPLHLQGDQPDCLLQSARMAEHCQTGVDPGLEAYKTPAIEKGIYDPERGTDLTEMESIIINERPGIEAQLKFENKPEDIKESLDNGESVIAAVDAYEFYKGQINLEPNSGGHAVVVTSAEKLPSGDWKFTVNDPNFEPPNQSVAGDRFLNAWDKTDKPMIVVKKTGVM